MFAFILMNLFSEQHGIYIMVTKLNSISDHNRAFTYIFSFKPVLMMTLQVKILRASNKQSECPARVVELGRNR